MNTAILESELFKQCGVEAAGPASPRVQHCPHLAPGMRACSQGLVPGSAQAHTCPQPPALPTLPHFICEMCQATWRSK